MNRTETEKYIADTFGEEIEFPWIKYPEYAVFRHSDNKKWFAVVMTVPASKFGLSDSGRINIINLKCSPAAVGSLRMRPGIYPAYHMNKANWISVSLDGAVSSEDIKMLLDISFRLTSAGKHKR